MAGIGVAVLFGGYCALLYGYILFKGYNVTPKMLFSNTWPPVVK